MATSTGQVCLTAQLHLVRHGETVANRAGILQGQSEHQLTPLGTHTASALAMGIMMHNCIGMQQAQATAVRFREHRWDRVYSSDLQRASDTAKAIAPQPNGIQFDQRLRECCLGVRENLPRGTTVEQAKEIVAAQLGVAVESVEDRSESLDDLVKRAAGFVDHELVPYLHELAAAGHSDVNVLVVSHGGLLRVMMGLLDPELGRTRRTVVSNCSVSKFQVRIVDEEVQFTLECIDDISHLADMDTIDPSALVHHAQEIRTWTQACEQECL